MPPRPARGMKSSVQPPATQRKGKSFVTMMQTYTRSPHAPLPTYTVRHRRARRGCTARVARCIVCEAARVHGDCRVITRQMQRQAAGRSEGVLSVWPAACVLPGNAVKRRIQVDAAAVVRSARQSVSSLQQAARVATSYVVRRARQRCRGVVRRREELAEK